MKVAKAAGVRRFINAPTSSVYGISDSPDVTEDHHPLVPLTLYNKYKGMCEPLLFKLQSPEFVCVTIRPATLCGYAPRQRLDLSMNTLTNHAITNRKIMVFGDAQLCPNLRVQDMCDCYRMLLEIKAAKIAGETFKVGFQNMSIRQLADVVKKVVEEEFPELAPIAIETTPSNDNRSYHVNSDKIVRALGFKTKKTIDDAVRGLCQAFREGKLPNSFTDDLYYNVRRIKATNAR